MCVVPRRARLVAFQLSQKISVESDWTPRYHTHQGGGCARCLPTYPKSWWSLGHVHSTRSGASENNTSQECCGEVKVAPEEGPLGDGYNAACFKRERISKTALGG